MNGSSPHQNALAGNTIGFWRSLAQPIAAQAPSAGVALIPATMAAVTGSYGTISFLLGLIAGLFLSYVFIQLSRRIASAGAVYSFARMVVGVGMAFVVVWCYLGNDMFVGSSIISQSADYLNAALQMSFGHAINWTIIAIVGAGFTGLWTAYYLKQKQPSLENPPSYRWFSTFHLRGNLNHCAGWAFDLCSVDCHV